MSGFSHRSPTKVKPRVAGAPRTLGLEFLERHYEGVGVERQAHARVAELCRHLSHRHTAPDVHARVAMARVVLVEMCDPGRLACSPPRVPGYCRGSKPGLATCRC
jgi:hypothetical protein